MKHFFTILLLLPFLSWSQKIKVNVFDKFIKQRRVETYPLTIKTAPNTKMDVAFNAVGSTCYLQLSGYGTGTGVVGVDDQVILLLDNDSTVMAKSTGLQTYDISKTPSTYKHDYVLSLADLEKLSRHRLQALRKYYSKDFDDIYVSEETGGKVKQLSSLFIDELKKANVLQGNNSQMLAQTVKKQEAVPSQPPGFPGGREVLLSFLNRNLKPPAELEAGEEKTVTVQFLVSADGTANNFKITQSAGPAFDNEVIRVLKRMPKWKPALENGRPVEAVVTQPVTFFRAGASAKIKE